MLKIKWTDKITNVEVFRRAKDMACLRTVINKRRNTWIGHILRHEGLLLTILEGVVWKEKCKKQAQTGICYTGSERSGLTFLL